MKQHIYADNAATTQLDKAALEAMMPWLLGEYGNASQIYAFAREPKKALKQARETIAECIGADPDEIFFTSCGSESDNWAVKGSAFADPGKRTLITSAFEHHAVLRASAAVERLGYPVVYLPPDSKGIIPVRELEETITGQTRMVSVMFANNEIGTIQPIPELCETAHSRGAVFHTDAVQAVGHLPIHVRGLGVDMLSASAHKFNGPKGIGFLYLKRGTALAPLIDGGSQEYGARAGTENVAAIVGMAVALRENCEALETNQFFLRELEKLFLERLNASGTAFLRNGGSETLPGLLSLSFPDMDGEAILHRMDLKGICISTGSACNSKETEISHVLRAIGLEESLAKGTIRVSFGKYNTPEEVRFIADSLITIIRS